MKRINYLKRGFLSSMFFVLIGVSQSFAIGSGGVTYYYVGGNNTFNTPASFTDSTKWSIQGVGQPAVGGIISKNSGVNAYVIDGSNVGGGVAGNTVYLSNQTALKVNQAITQAQIVVLNGTVTVSVIGGGANVSTNMNLGLSSGAQAPAGTTGITDALYVGAGCTLNIGDPLYTSAQSWQITGNNDGVNANTITVAGTLALVDMSGLAQTVKNTQAQNYGTPQITISGTLKISTSAAGATNLFVTACWMQVTGTVINTDASPGTTAIGLRVNQGATLEFPTTSPSIPSGISALGEVRFNGGGTLTFPSSLIITATAAASGLLTLWPTTSAFTTGGTPVSYQQATGVGVITAGLQYVGNIPQTVTDYEWPDSVSTKLNITINAAAGVTLPGTEPRTIGVGTGTTPTSRILTLANGTFTTLGVLTMAGSIQTALTATASTIIREFGTISAVPATTGAYNVIYFTSTNTATGNELPNTATALNYLAIAPYAGFTITLSKNVQVNSTYIGANGGFGAALELDGGGSLNLNGHTLTMATGTTIQIEGNPFTAENTPSTSMLSAAPTFAGTVNLFYNNKIASGTPIFYNCGPEFPSSGNLANLTITGNANSAYLNIMLPAGINPTVSGAFTLTGGYLGLAANTTFTVTGGFNQTSPNFFEGTPTSNLIINNGANAITNPNGILFSSNFISGGTSLNNFSITNAASTNAALGSSLTINGTLTVNMTGSPNNTFRFNNSTFQVLTLNGGFTYFAGTIAGGGTAALPTTTLVIGETSPGAASTFIWPNVTMSIPVDTLTLNRVNGMTLNASFTVGGAGTVASGNPGTLNLQKGLINTGAFSLIMNSQISSKIVQTTGSWVNGTMQWNWNNTSSQSPLTRIFTVGTLTAYRPVTLTLGSLPTVNASAYSIKTTDGNNPNIGTSTLNPSYTAKCFWTLTNVNIAAPPTYSAVFNFNNSDLSPGTLPTATSFIVNSYNGSWTPPGTANTRTLTSTQTVTGVTSPPNGGSVALQLGEINSPAAAAAITGGSTTICRGSTTNLTINVTSTGNWGLALSDGTTTASGAGSGTFTVPVSPTTTTTYTVLALADQVGYAPVANLTGSATVNVNPTPSLTESHVNVTCFGGNNGSINTTTTSGTPGFTYSWSNGATSTSSTSLTAGVYTITVSDANGCSATKSVSLTSPAALVASCGGSNISCHGANNGVASVTVTGGTTPYSYSWSNGASVSSINSLAANTYTVTVTDVCGNTTCSFTVNDPPVLNASCGGTPVSCNGGSNGSASVTASGGTPPYSYHWNTGGTASSLPSRAAATYSVTVTDSKGCSNTCSFTVTQPTALSISAASNTPVCATNNVNLSSTVAGGSTPYTSYSWSGPGSFTSTDANPVITASTTANSGTYTFTVTDALGCTATTTTSVTVTNCNTTLNLRLYIQGYYSGSGLMRPAMFNQGVLGSNSSQVDTITVELHNATTPYAIVETRKVILMTNDSATAIFSPAITSGLYYIAVKHRNSIQTWSAAPVSFTVITNYDFTGARSQAYKSNQALVDAGLWAFYSGDMNQDENIDLIDFPPLDFGINNGLFGYYPTDLTGDGNTDLLDFPVLDANIGGGIFSQHP